MIFILALIGHSASGKSTIEKVLCNGFGYNRVISYTSRPMRDGEQQDVDYHFISCEEFERLAKQGFFAEQTLYRGWHYGCAKEDLTNDKVIVIEPVGLKQILACDEVDVVSFFINVDRRSRLIKILERGDDVDEAIRRNVSDEELFEGIEDKVDFTVVNPKYCFTPYDLAKKINNTYKTVTTKTIL